MKFIKKVIKKIFGRTSKILTDRYSSKRFCEIIVRCPWFNMRNNKAHCELCYKTSICMAYTISKKLGNKNKH